MTFKRHNITRENEFTFNGIDLSNAVVVERINRQVLPSSVIQSARIPGRIGTQFQRNELGSRLITLSLRFIEDTYEDVQKRVLELSSALYSSKPQKLKLRDSDKYNYAIVSSITDVDKTIYTGSCEVIFECHDPFNYGATKTIPLTTTTNIVNDGTAPTTGVITAKASGNNTILITLNDGDFLKFESTFVRDATVVIDLEKQHATINGVSLMNKLTLDSDFFEFPKGQSQLKISGVIAGASLSLTKRWF